MSWCSWYRVRTRPQGRAPGARGGHRSTRRATVGSALPHRRADPLSPLRRREPMRTDSKRGAPTDGRGRRDDDRSIHHQAAGRIDLGCVRRSGGGQRRHLRRVLVHGVPPGRRQPRRRSGAEAATQARPRARRHGTRGPGVRRRRLRRVVPVRPTRRGAADQEPTRVRQAAGRAAGLANRVLLRRQGSSSPRRVHGRTRGSAGADRRPRRGSCRGVPGTF